MVVFSMLLKFALKEFQSDREYRNISPKTIKMYMEALNQFHDYCTDNEIVNLEDCTMSLVKQYLIYCSKERKNNPTTVNSKLHVLKIFFNYFENEMEIFTSKTNPTKRIQYAREEIKIEVFTDAQIKQMLNYYAKLKHRDKSFYAYRDHTIIITLIGTGMRLGELISIRWSDIDFVNQTVTVWGKKRQLSSIPMTDKLKKELSEYKVFCEQNFGELPEHVFTNREGKYLTENAIKCIFKHLKKKMNFNVRLSAHTFRHYFAVTCIRKGMDVFTLQKMLRHSNLAMTMRYVNLFGGALAELNAKSNPLNDLDI